MSQSVFDGVLYYISQTLPLSQRDQLSDVLNARGAKPVPSPSDPKLTHFITSSIALEDFVESLPEDSPAHMVTPRWVERSAVLASLQDPEYYSADPAYLFSGVTAAATDLSQADCELMSAAITALGGQWRSALTRDVTHLFALAPGSAKYDTAIHFKEQTGVCILVPHWFDDTVRLGIRDLPTKNYEWPEPRVFQQRPEGRTSQEDVEYEPPPERMMLYSTSSMSNGDQRKVKAAARNVWDGKRILLGLSLDLSDNQRKALGADIQRQGGEFVQLALPKSASSAERAREELEKLEEADVFVTRFRTGPAYAKAYKRKMTIGTLAWLWYVRASGTLTRPADQLLHYPIPDKPAEGFVKEVITVTNYTGKDREYLKKLITLMGGEFTASMSAERNTVVVAAYLHGTKTDKATSWSIPIVNHTWIEDCFVQWRRLTPAREKYIVFPPGVDFSTVLAERGLGRISWDPAQLEEMFHMAEAATDGRASPTSTKRVSASASPKKASPRKAKKDRHIEQPEDELPSGTAVSAGEVEEAVAVDDADVSLGGQMDVDADFAELEIGVADEEQMDVDEEAGPSKRPPLSKRGPPSKRAAEETSSADVSSKRRLVRRFTPCNTDDEGGAAPAGASSPKRPARTYVGAKAKEDAFAADSPTSSPSPVKKPQSSRRRIVDPDEHLEMDEPSEVQAPPKDKPKKKGPPGIRVTKVKAAPPPPEPKKRSAFDDLLGDDSDSSDEEDVRSVLGDLVKNGRTSRTGAARNADSKSSHTPQRLDSVLVPTVESIYGSPTKKGGKAEALGAAKALAKRAAPKTARRAAAPMDPPPVTAKKPTRAPSPVESERSASPPPKKRKTKPAPVEVPEAGPSRASSAASPTKTGRTPSRRSAATKATQKLHDVIMPDLVSFQKEMKNGTVRSAHEVEQSAAKGKARASEPGAGAEPKTKGKKRPSLGSGDEEAEEGMPEKKKRKAADADGPAPKGKKKGPGPRKSAAAATEGSVEPQSQESTTGARRKSLVPVTNNEPAHAETKAVRVMTTQLSFADDVMRRLGVLGVKFVQKPSECTHLVVKSVVRTEKFLCAMANAPYILNEKWAVISAASRKLLPEEDYMIQDPETEKKYGVNISDALKRAKKNAGKLFAGKTFYVTSKVPVETKLLKNVVAANGGQLLSSKTPTVRVLNGHDNHFVISCPADVSIWRPLAEHGHRVYTQELILTSALRQQFSPSETAFQVPGSY
ncbi:BRCT-containing protein 1 [Trametes pubescens]|uniref:BRCT-containing protein 1 n=1 Tax=Trametes pubescens TaxID=154538 RepID=A0A1M2VV62_TRAPU|nr:BRCT-containing protein 1 [Trametes pubescens]